MRMLLATALAAVVLSATTGPATDVTTTTATLHGTVSDADGYYFEYGTTDAYGLTTDRQTVEGGDDVPATAALANLTANTTYHYRVVGTSGLQRDFGGDMTFTTSANPAPPGVADSRSSAITPAAATLAANVDPRGAATSYYFQYGTTTSYGARRPTPAGELPPGTGEVPVAVTLDGLRPYTRYHWRLVATNAAGTTRGRDHTFRTDRMATAVTVGVSRHRVSYGRGVSLGGRVGGAGVNGMTLALQQAQFPFGQGFRDVRTTRAGSDGGYLFSVDNVWSTTRFRVVTRTQTVVASPTVTVAARVRPNVRARLRTRKRARIQGLIVPAVGATVTLQRRGADAIWRTLRSAAVQPADTTGTPYRFGVWRARKITRRYRVRVRLLQPGAYVGATSRAVKVSPRPAPARARRAAAG